MDNWAKLLRDSFPALFFLPVSSGGNDFDVVTQRILPFASSNDWSNFQFRQRGDCGFGLRKCVYAFAGGVRSRLSAIRGCVSSCLPSLGTSFSLQCWMTAFVKYETSSFVRVLALAVATL